MADRKWQPVSDDRADIRKGVMWKGLRLVLRQICIETYNKTMQCKNTLLIFKRKLDCLASILERKIIKQVNKK